MLVKSMLVKSMTDTARLRVRKLRRAALRVTAGMALLLSVRPAARAEEAHTVYIPMTFHAEARDIRTTACFRAEETVYAQAAWWQTSAAHSSAPERAFRAVITAMQSKDRAALIKWTDPKEAADTKAFDEQANAFFHQFE